MFYIVVVVALVVLAASADGKRDPFATVVFVSGMAYGIPYAARLVSMWERKGRMADSDDDLRVIPKDLPEATRENWKADLHALVEDHMSIDDFLARWSGRSPEKTLKGIEEEAAEAGKKEARLKSLLEEARRRMGV